MALDRGTLLLGTRKGLLFGRPNGAGYELRNAFPGIPISLTGYDRRDGSLWACQQHGHWGSKLHKSIDGGETWTEVAVPKYPEGATKQEGGEATMQGFWAFEPAGADKPKRIYAGTQPGGLFTSNDGGESWELCEPLWGVRNEHKWFGGGADQAAIHSIIIDPKNSDRLWVGISCGGVYESTDAGASWTIRNKGLRAEFLPEPLTEIAPHDPHCVVAAPSNPDVLWQQNHCGIWRSADGGKQWNEISEEKGKGPARFGFAVAADEKNDKTAWVIPGIADEKRMAVDGAMCVCRTTDGGATWTALRKGLPQSNCYDIVFRHALDIHGDTLAFGSSTGNVFFSHDRGESWTCLGNHFPPVYSVQFVK